MSLQRPLRRDVPADTASLGQRLLREDNVYRQIGEHFNELFPDETVFEPMYAETGRGAISPLLLSLVTVFQMLERVADRYAAELVITRIDWKYALHLPLEYSGFHFTDLYAFRLRLLEHGAERVVFEQILVRLKALGLIRDRGKMRTDSTHILGVLHRLSQLELITECVRVAVQAALVAAPRWCERELPQAFQEAYAQRQWEYGLSDAQVKAKCATAAKDGFWFLHVVDSASPKVVYKLAEVATLRTVLKQQFPDGPAGPPAKRPMGGDVIETPHEQEARCATKRGQTWSGYKAQVTETCDEDRPRLIVDLDVTAALDNDSPELGRIQARLQQQATLPGEQQVDQGYMSAENLVLSAQLGINLMGLPLDDTRGPPGFRQSDFRVDEPAHTATCPAGHKSSIWAQRATPSGKPPPTLVRFDASTCQACQFFGRCTRSSQGRSLTLHPYRAVLLARRAEAKTPAFQRRLHARAGIEATISELVRKHGLRWARYRGKAKVRLQAYFTATAADLKRTARWMALHSDLIPSLSLC